MADTCDVPLGLLRREIHYMQGNTTYRHSEKSRQRGKVKTIERFSSEVLTWSERAPKETVLHEMLVAKAVGNYSEV